MTLVESAAWFRAFAELEARGSSPIYERVALAIADDDELTRRLDALPPAKRQPNLLLAACRLLDAPVHEVTDTIAFVYERWSELVEIMASRSTQTNEPARTGALLPALAGLEGPIALIEVGASAGLCLYGDRYRIDYRDLDAIGPPTSTVQIEVECHGPIPVPATELQVVRRIGIDLHPLDVRDPDDVAWLLACIWPEHDERAHRLVAAAQIVAADPPEMISGDLVETIHAVLADIPPDVTPVVFHSAVLGYLAPDRRRDFAERVRAHPTAVWISNEGPGIVDGLTTTVAPPGSRAGLAYFLLGVAGTDVIAVTHPHGAWLAWCA